MVDIALTLERRGCLLQAEARLEETMTLMDGLRSAAGDAAVNMHGLVIFIIAVALIAAGVGLVARGVPDDAPHLR
jgi:hypothetical protein